MTKERKFAYLMAGLCGVSVASAIGSYIQHKRTASLLKKTVKELAKATPVEIEKEVVDEVIQEALEETKKEIKSQISRTVITAVSAEMGKCLDDINSMYTRMLAKAPNLSVNSSVNPGLHLQW